LGGVGRTVSNPVERAAAWTEIRNAPDHNFVVEVVVPELNPPSALSTDEVGEDVTAHPGWPPASTF
jgi:hypothetical protein